MAEHHDVRAGVYSGLFALIMIVALVFMAFVALEPQREPPLRMAEMDFTPDLPKPEIPIPKPVDGV
jgi:hypothetical protein